MITDIFKDAQDPLTNLFLTVVETKKCPLGQRKPPQIVPEWHIDYFELKLLKK